MNNFSTNLQTAGKSGAPGGTRTPDQGFRKPLLYPTELQAHKHWRFLAIHCVPFTCHIQGVKCEPHYQRTHKQTCRTTLQASYRSRNGNARNAVNDPRFIAEPTAPIKSVVWQTWAGSSLASRYIHAIEAGHLLLRVRSPVLQTRKKFNATDREDTILVIRLNGL